MPQKKKQTCVHPDRIWVAWNPDERQPFRVLGNSPREAYEEAGTNHDPVVIAEYHLAGLHKARRDFTMLPTGPKDTKGAGGTP